MANPSRMSVRLDHVVLEVEDPVRSLAFYGEVLGLPPVRLGEFTRAEAPFPSLRIGAGTILDLFPRRLWRGATPVNPNHLCLAYDRASASAIERRLKRLGVPITQRAGRNFGARGDARSIYFADPDGVTLEVRWYAEPGEAVQGAGRRKR
ncbi:MAG: VOC family protein [Vicinamibacteria bacterium]